MTTRIRHWLPILTFCPVNSLPDFIYITIEFTDKFVELYKVRKEVRALISGRKMYMEDAAKQLMELYPEASAVEVRLMLDRHVVTIHRNEAPDVRS